MVSVFSANRLLNLRILLELTLKSTTKVQKVCYLGVLAGFLLPFCKPLLYNVIEVQAGTVAKAVLRKNRGGFTQ